MDDTRPGITEENPPVTEDIHAKVAAMWAVFVRYRHVIEAFERGGKLAARTAVKGMRR